MIESICFANAPSHCCGYRCSTYGGHERFRVPLFKDVQIVSGHINSRVPILTRASSRGIPLSTSSLAVPPPIQTLSCLLLMPERAHSASTRWHMSRRSATCQYQPSVEITFPRHLSHHHLYSSLYRIPFRQQIRLTRFRPRGLKGICFENAPTLVVLDVVIAGLLGILEQ